MRRVIGIVTILLLAGVVALLVGCGPKAAEKTKIRWYVGLGSGGDAPAVVVEKKVVEDFNKSQNDIELQLEVVANAQAYNTLATEFSGGNSPDVVGPVGIRGRDSFRGAWADMEPLVKKYNYDLTQFDSAMVDFYRTEGQGLVGIPYAIYPSFIYVNKALFKEAGIPIPPQKFGQPYVAENGKSMPWDVDALRLVAMKLTVDANGNNATSKSFDPKKIVQFGFGQQFGDLRGIATLWGANTLVAPDGKSAQLPENWLKAWQWFYDGMWKDYFYPDGTYGNSDLLAKGDWFASGRLAMSYVHTWYAGFAAIQNLDWDISVAPSYNGKVTAKMHADTFEIARYSKNQDAAFKVIEYLATSPDLLNIYGGMPAKKTAQADWLKQFGATKFPGKNIDWQVVIDSVPYADNPNHESYMPSFQEASTRYTDFYNKMTVTPNLDLAKEEASLKADLTKIFAAAKN